MREGRVGRGVEQVGEATGSRHGRGAGCHGGVRGAAGAAREAGEAGRKGARGPVLVRIRHCVVQSRILKVEGGSRYKAGLFQRFRPQIDHGDVEVGVEQLRNGARQARLLEQLESPEADQKLPGTSRTMYVFEIQGYWALVGLGCAVVVGR